MCLVRVSVMFNTRYPTSGGVQVCANLASRGRSRSGRPASTVFCLTQSISHEGRIISISPLFCNDATFTVPGLCQFVSVRYLHRDGCHTSIRNANSIWCSSARLKKFAPVGFDKLFQLSFRFLLWRARIRQYIYSWSVELLCVMASTYRSSTLRRYGQMVQHIQPPCQRRIPLYREPSSLSS